MSIIANRVALFIPKAMTRVTELQEQLVGEYDAQGYQSYASDDLLLKVTETNDFIKLLNDPDYCGMTDREVSDTIDFYIDWLNLNEVIAANYQAYFMPVNVDNSVPTSGYATIQQLNQEIIARTAADSALNIRVTALESIIGGPVFPTGFFDNYDTTYSVVFDDDARLHTHNNLPVLQQITQDDVTNLQSLSDHYNSVGDPGGLHVSEDDRTAWNTPLRLGPDVNTNILFSGGDLIVTSFNGGLFRYADNYASYFDDRSLVDRGYVLSITGPLTTAVNSKLTVSLSGVSTGDVIYFNGTSWVNLGIGTTGTVLTSNGATPEWTIGASNGIPIGGAAGQFLKKATATDYSVSWANIATTDISGLTASVTELNRLAGFMGTSTELNYLQGVNSSVQTQLNNKLGSALVHNAILVGSASNIATPLIAGSNGYVLTIVGGSPQWSVPTGGGGGSISDANYGDITVSGVGTIWTINDEAVTFDKIQDITTDRLIGRSTAGTGPIEQISINSTLTLSSGTLGVTISGTVGQVPFVNATNNAFLYSAGLRFDSDILYTPNITINDLGIYASDQRSNYTDRVLADWGNVLSAKTYTGKQTFFNTVSTAGANVGSVSSDPSSLVNGDIWYNNTINKLRVRAGGVTASIGSVSSVAIASTDLSFTGGPITDAGTITLDINASAVTYAKIQNSAAGLTVLGRAANSTGVFGEIVAGTDGHVLRRSGTALGFGTIPNASLDNSSISFLHGTSGTDVNWSSSSVALGSTATLNIPDASTTARGLVTTGTQSIGGIKNFSVTSTGTTPTYTFSPTISATANSQRMTAVDISPTFTPGAFLSTINQGLLVRTGRVGFGTATPSSSLHVVGTSTTVSTSTLLLTDSAGTSLLEMLDDGLLRFGSTGSRPTITTSLNTTTPNKGGASLLFNAAGSIPHIFTAPATGVAELVRYVGGLTTNSASAAYLSLNIAPVINQTGTANGEITGVLYNPTLTGLLGNLYGLIVAPSASKNAFALGLIGSVPVVPTAKVHIGAGTATAGTAPIKLVSGVPLTTTEDGALEYHNSHLFFTIGSTRYQLDQGGTDIQGDSVNPGATINITVTSSHTFKYVNPLNSNTTINVTGGSKGSKMEIMVRNDNTSAWTITWGTGMTGQSPSHLLTQNKTTIFYYIHNGSTFFLTHISPPL